MRSTPINKSIAVACAALFFSGASAAPPVPSGKGGFPAPTLLRHYTVQLYDMPQGTFAAQFDPAKGQLRGVSAKLSGLVRYKVTLAGPPGANAAYAFTAYAPAYAGNAWFDLQAKGQGSFTNEATQQIGGQAGGEGAAKGPAVDKVFVGKGTVRLTLSPDLPKFTAGLTQVKNVEPQPSSLGGSITYTYLPAIKIIAKPK